jgi:hypothetical protein
MKKNNPVKPVVYGTRVPFSETAANILFQRLRLSALLGMTRYW